MGIKEVLRKSVLRNTITSLTKARPTKYYRREKVKGKWRYYYTREQYQKEKGTGKGVNTVTVAGKTMLEVVHNGKVFRVNSNGVVQPKEGWKEGYAWGTKQATGNESYAVMNKVHAAGYKASGIGDSKKYNFKVPPATSVQQGKVSVSTKDKKPVPSVAGGGARKGGNGKDSEFDKMLSYKLGGYQRDEAKRATTTVSQGGTVSFDVKKNPNKALTQRSFIIESKHTRYDKNNNPMVTKHMSYAPNKESANNFVNSLKSDLENIK